MIQNLLQVALGGAVGASLRYLTVLGTRRAFGEFPWGTITVNVIGSFLMGVVVFVLAQKFDNRFAPLLMTGVLGGFTTFSAFSLDAVSLVEKGRLAAAGFYVTGTVGLSLMALVAGIALARGIWA